MPIHAYLVLNGLVFTGELHYAWDQESPQGTLQLVVSLGHTNAEEHPLQQLCRRGGRASVELAIVVGGMYMWKVLLK